MPKAPNKPGWTRAEKRQARGILKDRVSGYDLKRLYRWLSTKLGGPHLGHRLVAFVSRKGQVDVWLCSCGLPMLIKREAYDLKLRFGRLASRMAGVAR